MLGSTEDCDFDLDSDLDGDGTLSYEEAFAGLIGYQDIESVPLSDITAWIDPEDDLVARIELIPPASLEGGQRVAADGVLRAEYSRFGETTLTPPETFVEEFTDSRDGLSGMFPATEEMPPVPDGLEALSKNLMILANDTGPGTTTLGIPLVERIDSANSVGFYSFVDEEWVKLDIGVRLKDGGCTVEAGLGDIIPENIGVLREK